MPSHIPSSATPHPSDQLISGTTILRMSEIDHPPSKSNNELWTYHFDLSLVDGRKASAFVAFCQTTTLVSRPPAIPVGANQQQGPAEAEPVHSYVVQFAISLQPGDAVGIGKATPKGRYYLTSAMDSNHLEQLRCTIEVDTHMDPFIRHSLLDMLSRGRVPAPDSLITGDVSVSTHGLLSLKYGDVAGVERLPNDSGEDVYHLVAQAKDGSYGFEIDFVPRRASVNYQTTCQHPSDSVIPDKGSSHLLFPSCKVSGKLRLEGSIVAIDPSNSTGWYERESRGNLRNVGDKIPITTESAWTWALLRLSNGWNLKLRTEWRVDVCSEAATLLDERAILISPEWSCTAYENHGLKVVATWSSTTSLNDYGTKWRVSIPELELDISVEAWFPQQEFTTICAGRGYWKGGVTVTGLMGVIQVKGSGVIESKPAQWISSLEKHLKRAARLTAVEVSKIYPERLVNAEHAMKTLGFTPSNDQESDSAIDNPARYMEDVSLDVLYQHIFAPVRHLINGTGKSWRSYMSMISIAVLGADPEPYRPLVAAIELVHTGTLIIDDIQDESPIRRGVPAVHTMWGIASAINAGEAAYFAFHTAIQSIPDLTAEKKLGLLEIFLEAMRFAHAGQALDIAGQQQSLLDNVIAGNVEPSTLEKSILSVHRLKTAVVASHIAKMSALLAGAPQAETKVLAAHWERVGLAFQIIDDVYDIRRGSKTQEQKEGQRMEGQKPLKQRGDDIRLGKITIPIAKAGQMMPLSEAKQIWDIVLSKPGDDDVATEQVIEKLEEYGVVDACIAEAQKMVNDSWLTIDEHLADSHAKIYLHALCRYMSEYHSI